MSIRRLVVLVAWTTASLFCALASAGDGDLAPPEVERGEKVYRRACASCHGRDGTGDGPAARSLDPRPRDLTSGKYKFRSTPTGSPPTDEDLYRIVTAGIPRTYMFAWEDLLSERERRDVVAYIKTLSDVFEQDATPIQIPQEPPVTTASLIEGKSLYMVMQCWSCHGSAGQGDGERAETLLDDEGRPIRAFDFTIGAYKGGSDAHSVFKTFDTGLNGTPMPSYAEAFLFGSEAIRPSSFADAYAQEELDALTAYQSSQPTDAELAAMSEAQKQDLVARRKWALVHYVKSLSRETGLFHWLLVDDTEVVN